MEFENGFPPDDIYSPEYVDHGDLSPDVSHQELSPDEEYELWCHYWDMQREQLLAAWGVESLEELEFLGHDW